MHSPTDASPPSLRTATHGLGPIGSLLLHRIGLAPTAHCRSPGALRKILDTTRQLDIAPLRLADRMRHVGRLRDAWVFRQRPRHQLIAKAIVHSHQSAERSSTSCIALKRLSTESDGSWSLDSLAD